MILRIPEWCEQEAPDGLLLGGIVRKATGPNVQIKTVEHTKPSATQRSGRGRRRGLSAAVRHGGVGGVSDVADAGEGWGGGVGL